jgi:putative heme-binding domain-containing protein
MHSRSGRPVVIAAAIWCAVAATPSASAQDRLPRAASRPTRNPLEGDAQAIANGKAMFRTRCAGCHGPDARGYLGPDLTGFWAAGGGDDRMFDIVRRGVPGTEMPPSDPLRVLDKDIWQTLAYVRTLSGVIAPAPTGDAANGERIFRANCNSCHTVNGRGGQLGPNLSRIGSGRPRAGLAGKLRGSAGFMRPGYEPVTIVTRDGERIRGIKKNEDEFSIQIMDTRERLQGYLKANLAEITIEKQSLMPVYGPDRMNDHDLDDLLRYLTGLRADAERKEAR